MKIRPDIQHRNERINREILNEIGALPEHARELRISPGNMTRGDLLFVCNTNRNRELILSTIELELEPEPDQTGQQQQILVAYQDDPGP